MNAPCAVVIAAPQHLSAITARLAAAGDVLEFADGDALRALETIVRRRPSVVAFERLFAATPRGAALINRIKADPKLNTSEIRVLAHDSDYQRVSPRAGSAPGAPLDQRGTRRASRFKMKPSAGATVDGQQAEFIDLSTVGAQLISAATMKPNQRVKITLEDTVGMLQFEADVAWASYEIRPSGGPRFRAGLAFVEADTAGVNAFCLRHKAG